MQRDLETLREELRPMLPQMEDDQELYEEANKYLEPFLGDLDATLAYLENFQNLMGRVREHQYAGMWGNTKEEPKKSDEDLYQEKLFELEPIFGLIPEDTDLWDRMNDAYWAHAHLNADVPFLQGLIDEGNAWLNPPPDEGLDEGRARFQETQPLGRLRPTTMWITRRSCWPSTRKPERLANGCPGGQTCTGT